MRVCVRVCACARFGAGGHTFNFARPITKSDMHHSEINSQQQRRGSRAFCNEPKRLLRAGGGEEEAAGTRGTGGRRRRSARKMSPTVVAGSSYLPSELPVNDNPWCTALPCLSHVYQLSLCHILSLSFSLSLVRARAHHLLIFLRSALRLSFVFSSEAILRDFVRPPSTLKRAWPCFEPRFSRYTNDLTYLRTFNHAHTRPIITAGMQEQIS